MNEDDIKAYAYMVEDALTKPEMFQLAVEQLAEQLDQQQSVIASVLLGCYACHNLDGSVHVFLRDWINTTVEGFI